MSPSPSKVMQALAFCRVLKSQTGSYGLRWRSIAEIAQRAKLDDPQEAVALAVENGWVEVVADRSVGLTADGLQLS